MMKKNKGFTLIEVIVIIIILGVLASMVTPLFIEPSNKVEYIQIQ